LKSKKRPVRNRTGHKFYREETPRKGNGVSDAEHLQHIVRRKMFQDKYKCRTINSRYSRAWDCER